MQAFSHLRQQRPARLVILGEGGLRGQLQTLIKELELEADVDLPGFEANPYQYMSRSRVFVLSSRWGSAADGADRGNGLWMPGRRYRLPLRARRNFGRRRVWPTRSDRLTFRVVRC
ncbi:MAG: glycosyltransferase, partial [Leptolyngbyaceae cyanobacterium SU_3_3]|nr:glycosyltransferase [Leptolyngbyaceae cyanobacterium SU_3_3]